MAEKKILVLGVGGNVSQGIIKAIRHSKLPCTLVGACVRADSVGLYLCDSAYISPYANDAGFVPWLVDTCKKEQIDMIFTGVEENIMTISKEAKTIHQKTNSLFIASSWDMLCIGQDKLLTCDWLKINGCNYPPYCDASDEEAIEALIKQVGYPLIAKPRRGKGSNGIYRINSHEQLNKLQNCQDYVLQQCIGDDNDEYTVGCYCDKSGQLRGIITMHRILVHGYTQQAKVVRNEVIEAQARKICEAFKPTGPLNIQLRLDSDGRPVCFELNVRFSGTTPMRARFGYQDVYAMITEYLYHGDIEDMFQVVAGTAYRYTSEMYIMDDTINEIGEKGFIGNISQRKIICDEGGHG